MPMGQPKATDLSLRSTREGSPGWADHGWTRDAGKVRLSHLSAGDRARVPPSPGRPSEGLIALDQKNPANVDWHDIKAAGWLLWNKGSDQPRWQAAVSI